ncbi:MAG: hypothetical protein EPO22_14700 [Dehalococcoidia bacterium]|nr:MAG: hypothetical protein EPO22_14700 [Dehalococcoidia bacterium]
MTYYWHSDAVVERDLSATTLFFDARGAVQSIDGFPAWSQTRTIGQGVRETSAWRPGDLVRESYFALVPRTIAAGEYDVRIAVYDPASVRGATLADAARFVSIGKLSVR